MECLLDLPGEKVLVRLIDLLQTSAGSLFGTWQEKRIGKARAEARVAERLMLEQAELDVAEIRSGRKKIDRSSGLMIESSQAPLLLTGPVWKDRSNLDTKSEFAAEFTSATFSTARANEMQRAINLKHVSLFAEEAAEEMDSAEQQVFTEGLVDPDWFSKWRNTSLNVLQEEMQRL